MGDHRIPCDHHHRGVGIQRWQNPKRVAQVCDEIDRVYAMSSVEALAAYAEDPANPPETRLFAAAKIRALHQQAEKDRATRPSVDFDRLGAITAGLDSLTWISPTHFGTDLDPSPRSIVREIPLDAAEIEALIGEAERKAWPALSSSCRASGRS
jgi:hypothetical protein